MNSYVDNIMDLLDLHIKTSNDKYKNKALELTTKVIPNAIGVVVTDIDESIVTAISSINKSNAKEYLPAIKRVLRKCLK